MGKLVRIVPAAPYPGAIGFPYSQVASNIEQELPETEAAELVASGAFRYGDAPPFRAKSSQPTEARPDAGPSDSAADAAPERSEPA